MGNKNKKIWEIKRRIFFATLRSCTLSHFSNANFKKFLMTAKASKLHNLSLLVGKLPEYCNTWKCFTYTFEAEKQGDLFSFFFNLELFFLI